MWTHLTFGDQTCYGSKQNEIDAFNSWTQISFPRERANERSGAREHCKASRGEQRNE